MPRNVEIKARVNNLGAVEAEVRNLADEGPFELTHDDTFFDCPNGRLKLRELTPARGELIFYVRQDTPGPKLSEYFVVPTSSPEKMREVLRRAYGEIGRIRKRRRLYLIQNTRVHLDQVEGLGSFLELEVVLAEGKSVAEGEARAASFLSQLKIPETDLVRVAYLDLLREAR